MTKQRHLRAVLLASTCLFPGSALADDDFSLDDQPASPAAVEKPVTVNEAGLSTGYRFGNSAVYGRYTGVTEEGPMASSWLHLEQRALGEQDGTFYAILDAQNIDFATNALAQDAAVRLRLGHQGKWSAYLGYEGIPAVATDNFHTLYDSNGALQNGLAARSLSTTAATGVPQAAQYLSVATVGTRRDKVKGGGSLTGPNDWVFGTAFEHEHKQGTKANSFMFINNNYFASFLEPVDYDTERFTVSANFTKPRFQSQVSYTYSLFTNNMLQWVGMNPFNSGTLRTGYSGSQYTLPPSNSEHMLKGVFGLNVGDNGRLTLNTRYSVQVQNETMGGRYYDAGTFRVNDSAYDGLIQNAYANLSFSTRPLKDWTLRAAYTIDDRDNQSDTYRISRPYRSDVGTTVWNGSGAYMYTMPYSFLNQKAEIENGYRLSRSTRVSGTYTHVDKQRDYAVTNRNQENIAAGKVQTALAADVTGQLEYSHAIRQAQDYNGNLGWNYMGRTVSAENELSQYNYAARRQDAVKASVNWAVGEDASLGGNASWTNNFYPNATYGVTEDHTIAVGPDLAWTPFAGLTSHLYYSYQEIFTAVTINANSAANGLIWKLKNEDAVHTIGGGFDWQVNDRLKLRFDNALSYGLTSFALAGALRNGAATAATTTPTNLPDSTTWLNTLTLNGEYDLGDGLSFGLTGQWEHMLSKDYLNWQEAVSTGNTTSQTVVLDATGNPSYSAGLLLATLRLKW